MNEIYECLAAIDWTTTTDDDEDVVGLRSQHLKRDGLKPAVEKATDLFPSFANIRLWNLDCKERSLAVGSTSAVLPPSGIQVET